MKKSISLMVAALSLTACASQPTTTPTSTQSGTLAQPVQIAHTAQTQKYDCDNGLTVYTKNIADDKLELVVQDYRAIMSIAPAASGNRYIANQGLFGAGGEWHTKGGEAYFGYVGTHGNRGETVCRLG